MRSIKILIAITVVVIAARQSAMAQQDALYTQYMFNTLAINPAYAGSRNVASVTALYRAQWVGVPGAPKTATITLDAPISNKKIGLGIQVFDDEIGITKNTGVLISYAFRIQMDKGTLSMGLQGGVSQFRADFTSVNLGSDHSTDQAFLYNINKSLANFGLGFYYNTDNFYVGLSSPQILNSNITNFTVSNQAQFAGWTAHVFLETGYVFPLGEDMHLKPSVLIKEVRGAPIEADINATLWLKDVLGLGVQYRSEAAVAILVELQATQQLRIGYSYDYSTTNLAQYNTGTHEIVLRYEFGYPKGKILSPRYF